MFPSVRIAGRLTLLAFRHESVGVARDRTVFGEQSAVVRMRQTLGAIELMKISLIKDLGRVASLKRFHHISIGLVLQKAHGLESTPLPPRPVGKLLAKLTVNRDVIVVIPIFVYVAVLPRQQHVFDVIC